MLITVLLTNMILSEYKHIFDYTYNRKSVKILIKLTSVTV